MTAPTEPLTLPCGVTVKNRLLKGAMSEALGTHDHAPRPELPALYARWAGGGTGILLTGNVMVDARALGEPGNVVLEDERHLAEFHAWAVQGSRGGARRCGCSSTTPASRPRVDSMRAAPSPPAPCPTPEAWPAPSKPRVR